MNKKSLVLASLLVATATFTSCGSNNKPASTPTTVTPTTESDPDLAEATSALKKFILTQDKGTVTATFTCVSTVTKGDTTYDIVLTSDSAAAVVTKTADGYSVAINQQDADTLVTLTASVTVNGKTASKTITFTVPAKAQVEKLSDIATLIGKADGHDSSKNVITYGLENDVTVIGFCSTSGVILADATSQLYVYDSAMVKEVKIGDNIKVSSVDVYRYYGLPEGVNITYEKVSSGNATPTTATTATTIKDLVEKMDAFETGYKAPAADFAKKYKASAKIEVLSYSSGTNIVLSDPEDSTKFILGYYKFADLDNLKSLDGFVVDVEFCLYDLYRNKDTEIGGERGTVSSGTRFYYIGGTPAIDISKCTDAQKAKLAVGDATKSLKVASEASAETTINLPTAIDEKYGTGTITASFASTDDAEVFSIVDGKAVVKPTVEKKEGTLTVKVTIGDSSSEVTYKITAQSNPLAAKTSVDTETTYKFGVVNTNASNEVLFLSKKAATGNYLATTKIADDAADVKFEAVDSGFNMKVGDKYLNAELASSKVKFTLSDTATTVYTWDDSLKTVTYSLEETEYYIGTYSSYTTLSGSKTSYASTSFVGQLYAA